MRALIAGDPDRAEQLATEALQIGTDSGQPDAAIFFGAQLMLVAHQRGTMGDLVPLIEQQATEAPEIGEVYRGPLAAAHADADRIDDARQLLAEFAASGFELPLNPLWSVTMISYVEAAIVVRDPDYAVGLFERLEPWADQWATMGSSASNSPMTYYLGALATVLGRYDEANGYLARSATLSQRVGAKFVAARTDLLWGEMHAARNAPGDADQARDLLTQARAAAAANGYATVERRAAAALQQIGRGAGGPSGRSAGSGQDEGPA